MSFFRGAGEWAALTRPCAPVVHRSFRPLPLRRLGPHPPLPAVVVSPVTGPRLRKPLWDLDVPPSSPGRPGARRLRLRRQGPWGKLTRDTPGPPVQTPLFPLLLLPQGKSKEEVGAEGRATEVGRSDRGGVSASVRGEKDARAREKGN